jgi:hypothetical protein
MIWPGVHMSRAIAVCPLDVIGVVRTGRSVTGHAPVQAALNRAETGTVEIFVAYADGLSGLAGFDPARAKGVHGVVRKGGEHAGPGTFRV